MLFVFVLNCSSIRIMTRYRIHCSLIHSLDIMNVRHIRFNILAPHVYILDLESLSRHGPLVSFHDPGAHFLDKKVGERHNIPGL